MADHIAVQRLVHRYADAVVHRDAAQWGRCWAEDAQWDLGRGRHVEGRPAIVELWQSAMAGMAAVVQNVVNGDAWLRGRSGRHGPTDGGTSTSGSVVPTAWPASCWRTTTTTTCASADGWLFTNRVLRVHYMGAPDLSADFMNTEAALGARAADA